MPKLYKLIFLILFFPATLQAQTKIQMELLSPLKPFKMQVGEDLEIKFSALTSPGTFFYGIFLEHADPPPWKNGSGPLTLKPLPLEQGTNVYKWNGESFAQAPSDGSEMAKLKKKTAGTYYLNVLIFDTNQVEFLGVLANYHKHKIFKMRSKNFEIL